MRTVGEPSKGVKAAVVVVAVALGAGVVSLVGDDDPSFDTAATGVTASVPPTTTPPTVEEIVAGVKVETGLTPGQVVACDSAGGRATGFYPAADNCPPEQLAVIGEGVTYGIVVENTTEQVLLHVPVTYRFLDAAGQVVAEPSTVFSDADLASEERTIDILWPGQRFGFGGMRYRDRPGVERVEVEVGEPAEWMPEIELTSTRGPVADPSALTTEDVTVTYGDQNEPIVRFTVRSSEERDIDRPTVYAVLRDGSGRIIGCVDGWLDDNIPAGGSVEREVRLDDPLEVPGIDPAKVEIYFSAFAV